MPVLVVGEDILLSLPCSPTQSFSTGERRFLSGSSTQPRPVVISSIPVMITKLFVRQALNAGKHRGGKLKSAENCRAICWKLCSSFEEVRKFTYFDYYRTMPSEFDFYNVSLKLVRTHIGKFCWQRYFKFLENNNIFGRPLYRYHPSCSHVSSGWWTVSFILDWGPRWAHGWLQHHA